ncbi:MAG: hypothetical protein ACYCPP_07035 [Nitrososphaerales archaeon]
MSLQTELENVKEAILKITSTNEKSYKVDRLIEEFTSILRLFPFHAVKSDCRIRIHGKGAAGEI